MTAAPIIFAKGTTPAAPSAGKVALYVDSSGIPHYVDETGADSALIDPTAASAAAAAAAASEAAASSSATAAASAQTAAEAARDAAQLSAGVYADTAAGLAATTSGQYFSVPSADSAEYLILYKNNAGSAVEVKRYPSADRVAGLEGQIASVYGTIDHEAAGLAVPITDEDGWMYGGFYMDGSFFTPSFAFDVPTGTLATPDYTIAASADAFIVVDEDGWVVFDAENAGASGATAEGRWANKSFLLFGDSITQTGDVDNGDFGLGFRTNWPDYAFGYLSMTQLRNYAKSGASFREYVGQTDWQKISHQVTQASTNNETPDVIVVSAGTNDGTANLGSYNTAMGKATLGDLDRSLTIEAMRWAFWTIRTEWPDAVCFAALPLQRADAETADRIALLDAIEQMAGRYGFVLIDAHRESGIVKDFEVWGGVGRDLYDGLHPQTSGQQKQAALYTRVIKTALNY